MQQTVFSLQIEDGPVAASPLNLLRIRQGTITRAAANTTAELAGHCPDDDAESCCWAGSDACGTMQAAMNNSINPHRRTMLILFDIPLLYKDLEGRGFL